MAAVALLLIGLTINYFAHYGALLTANTEDPKMKAAMASAKTVASDSTASTTKNTDLVAQFEKVVTTAKNLQSNVDGRARGD